MRTTPGRIGARRSGGRAYAWRALLGMELDEIVFYLCGIGRIIVFFPLCITFMHRSRGNLGLYVIFCFKQYNYFFWEGICGVGVDFFFRNKAFMIFAISL
jgi:hypothetical protein